MIGRGNPNEKLEQLKHAAAQARLPFERETWLNVAFRRGFQYSEWHQDRANRNDPGYLRTIPRPKGTENHPRPVINKIMHFVRTAQSDALQDRPTGDVLPPTADYTDRSDSAVAKAWIEDQTDANKTDYDTRLSRAVLWALMGGGYLKWCWGKDGPVIHAPSFFEIYLDPYAKTFKDCRYIIHSQFMDPEQVYENWGKEIKATSTADEAKTELLRGMGSSPVIQGVVVNEIWYKPCRRYPEGMYAVWTGREQLVPPGKLPYPHLIKYKMLPFTQLGVIESEDSPYYLSPVQFLRPPQMELNKYHAQMLLNRERFTNGKWWIPQELQLDQDPDDSPSQILRGNSTIPGLKPEIIQPMVFPGTQDLDVLEQGMMHVVGQREVSNAQVPGRVEAAKAIELLKEADAGALAVLRKTIQTSNDQGWFHMLQLARVFQKEADMVTSYSKEGIPEVKHFRAGEMKPGHRVRTTMQTGLARSRANRSDLALRLWDSKVIQDPEVMAEILEMPLPNTMRDRAEDTMLARNENYTLAGDEAVDANSWDDHATHIREHNAYRKTTEYLMASPEVKRKFEMHVQRHMSMEEIQVGRQAKLQIIANGGQPAQPAPAPSADPNAEEAP